MSVSLPHTVVPVLPLSFPTIFTFIFLSHNTPDTLFQFFHPLCTLWLTSASSSPSSTNDCPRLFLHTCSLYLILFQKVLHPLPTIVLGYSYTPVVYLILFQKVLHPPPTIVLGYSYTPVVYLILFQKVLHPPPTIVLGYSYTPVVYLILFQKVLPPPPTIVLGYSYTPVVYLILFQKVLPPPPTIVLGYSYTPVVYLILFQKVLHPLPTIVLGYSYTPVVYLILFQKVLHPPPTIVLGYSYTSCSSISSFSLLNSIPVFRRFSILCQRFVNKFKQCLWEKLLALIVSNEHFKYANEKLVFMSLLFSSLLILGT